MRDLSVSSLICCICLDNVVLLAYFLLVRLIRSIFPHSVIPMQYPFIVINVLLSDGSHIYVRLNRTNASLLLIILGIHSYESSDIWKE